MSKYIKGKTMCMREARFNLGLVQCPLMTITKENEGHRGSMEGLGKIWVGLRASWEGLRWSWVGLRDGVG